MTFIINFHIILGMYKNVSLLISSCDKYKILLEPFITLFRTFFSSFDGPIFTSASAEKNLDNLKIKGINPKYSKLDFSTRLIKTLKLIKTEYVLFFLDDFFLYKNVETNLLDSALKCLDNNKKISSVLLTDQLHDKDVCLTEYNEFFMIKKNKSPYICTTQATLWRKKELIKILRKGESAWDFESIGSFRLSMRKRINLYRKDIYDDCISYPVGGVIWRGSAKNTLNVFKKYPFYDSLCNLNFNTKYNNKTIKQNIFQKFTRNLYPYFSIVFPFIKRFGTGVPSFIAKRNSLEKINILQNKVK